MYLRLTFKKICIVTMEYFNRCFMIPYELLHKENKRILYLLRSIIICTKPELVSEA